MSRYYIYDSYTDSVAEFATRWSKEQKKKGLPAFGRDARELVAQNDYNKAKKAKPKASLDSRLNRMRQINMTNAANRKPLGAAMPVNAVRDGLIGHPSQRKLMQNILGTSVAGRAGRALALGALGTGVAVRTARALNKRKRDRNSIRGRVRALLGR